MPTKRLERTHFFFFFSTSSSNTFLRGVLVYSCKKKGNIRHRFPFRQNCFYLLNVLYLKNKQQQKMQLAAREMNSRRLRGVKSGFLPVLQFKFIWSTVWPKINKYNRNYQLFFFLNIDNSCFCLFQFTINKRGCLDQLYFFASMSNERCEIGGPSPANDQTGRRMNEKKRSNNNKKYRFDE